MYSWEWLGGNIEIHELKLVNFVSSSPVLSKYSSTLGDGQAVRFFWSWYLGYPKVHPHRSDKGTSVVWYHPTYYVGGPIGTIMLPASSCLVHGLLKPDMVHHSLNPTRMLAFGDDRIAKRHDVTLTLHAAWE